ncbi:MAG: hypothetical protein JSV78_12895 [Phycisphaerales bacterium]|nr:MAG: hypothetical protein JSV78_12895 [Phycisphaerales bacterium]
MSERADKDRIENLIVRSLDGELSDDEQLELDRAVLRAPEARRLKEDYERIDALATAALSEAVGDQPPAFDPMVLTGEEGAARKAAGQRSVAVARHHWAWWLMPGAIAAAILAALLIPTSLLGPEVHQPQAFVPATTQHMIPEVASSSRPSELPEVRPVLEAPRKIKRTTDRRYIGVLGEDGRIYWLEIDRIRTIKGLKPEAKAAFGDL